MTRDEGTGADQGPRAVPGPPQPRPMAPMGSGPPGTLPPAPPPSYYPLPGYPPMGYGPPPGWGQPGRRFRARAVVIGWVGGLAVGIGLSIAVAALAASVPDEPVNGDPGTRHDAIASAEAAPKQGDCLSGSPAEADLTTKTDVTGCAARHGSEVVGVVTMPQSAAPPRGDEEGFFVDDACRIVFHDYIGISWDDSELDFLAVPPTRAAWRAGDHTLYCLLYSHDYNDGRGSARNSAA